MIPRRYVSTIPLEITIQSSNRVFGDSDVAPSTAPRSQAGAGTVNSLVWNGPPPPQAGEDERAQPPITRSSGRSESRTPWFHASRHHALLRHCRA